VTPNEHDDRPSARGADESVADGAFAVSITPIDDSGAEPEAGAASEGGYDSYLTSGANPFSSVHPTGTGGFPRLQPRQFPPDESPADVPEMEQLPDPNALPDPGYPVLAGYSQAFPSPFPSGAYPSGSTDERAAYPVEDSDSSEDTSTFQMPGAAEANAMAEQAPASDQVPPDTVANGTGPADDSVPADDLSPGDVPADTAVLPEGAFSRPVYQSPYSSNPYVAPRSPEAAPPLAPPLASHDGQPSAWQRAAWPSATPPPVPPASTSEPPAPTFASAPPAQPPFDETAVDMDGVPGLEAPAPEVPARETADSLTTEMLLHGRRPLPIAGWRRALYRATGGLVHVGESNADLRRRDLINRARTPVAGGHHRVAVMSLKGGVGKTTTAVGLGATLASLRGDRVIAMDANPDRGTLSDKVRLETSATVRDLLNERAQVTRYADVRAFTSQSSSRLEILASDRDPAVSVAFSADDYRAVSRVLEHYYSICITDCGTGLLHSAMSGILELADHIVLVSSPSVDGARSASATLDWLEAHGYTDLVRGAVVVLSTIRPRSKSTVDLDRLEQHFAARCRAVVRIPYDAHLEEGAEFELELLDSETADAYLDLAALVGDGFAVPRRLGTSAVPGSPFA
jgi:MinD-like ATPase involved in chromosome partitioning or flagellar assembly